MSSVGVSIALLRMEAFWRNCLFQGWWMFSPPSFSGLHILLKEMLHYLLLILASSLDGPMNQLIALFILLMYFSFMFSQIGR